MTTVSSLLNTSVSDAKITLEGIMQHTHTLVVRYPEGECPGYSADTKVNGGELVAVDFDGNRLHVCQELEEALDRMVTQFGPIDWCDTEDAREAVELAIAALAKAREVKP